MRLKFLATYYKKPSLEDDLYGKLSSYLLAPFLMNKSARVLRKPFFKPFGGPQTVLGHKMYFFGGPFVEKDSGFSTYKRSSNE